MRYRKLGNTGIEISSLGFGCMRLPMIKTESEEIVDQEKTSEMIKRAYDLGVNHFDTAYFYCGHKSEKAIGIALKDFRKNVYVSTKVPGGKVKEPGDARRILEEQLNNIDTDYLDIYYFHGIGYDNFLEVDKRGSWLKDVQKAKEEGLVKHISFSFHDDPKNMIKLADMGCFESVLCQYNVIDRKNEEAMEYLKSKGLGVIVMGPLGGGRVSGLPIEMAKNLGIEVKSSAELALRFVLANQNVDCALSGMGSLQMVEENIATASNELPLSTTEVDAINAMMKENEKLAQLYCTGCAYCMPCPAEVNIPYIFQMMNYHKVYGLTQFAKNGYNGIGVNQWTPGKQAYECTSCGICETKCPQKIKIRQQLKECDEALAIRGCTRD
jgi:predicted aldo/keto reductase-like oxidoreductase